MTSNKFDPRLLSTLLSALMWLFNRRAPRLPTRPTDNLHLVAWHQCHVDSCSTRIRPREIMCVEHWIRGPVQARMAITALMKPGLVQSPDWVRGARHRNRLGGRDGNRVRCI